jgi:hypothetical protein
LTPAPRHRPVHLYVEGGCYFITAATLRHQPLLRNAARRAWFATALATAVSAEAAELIAWVVLPNHYHAVVRVADSGTIPRLLYRMHRDAPQPINWRGFLGFACNDLATLTPNGCVPANSPGEQTRQALLHRLADTDVVLPADGLLGGTRRTTLSIKVRCPKAVNPAGPKTPDW